MSQENESSKDLTESLGVVSSTRFKLIGLMSLENVMLSKMKKWSNEKKCKKKVKCQNLNKNEQNEYMDTLYQFANPNSELVRKELKERAGEIYHIIRNQAKNGYYWKC